MAQHFDLAEGVKSQKIKFKLINNLIVIPLEVNGAKLSFILDSGVSKPILFNLSETDSVQLNNVSEITIKGLGDGEPIKALSSKGNVFRLKHIENFDQQLYVVIDKDMNFSPTLGIPIHGIIGYDLFRDFIVDINYSNQVIRFHDPEQYRPKPPKNSKTLPLAIIKNKAYIQGNVLFEGKEEDIPVNLLVDTGSSDAIWLFQDQKKGIGIPEKDQPNLFQDFFRLAFSWRILKPDAPKPLRHNAVLHPLHLTGAGTGRGPIAPVGTGRGYMVRQNLRLRASISRLPGSG